MLPPFPESFVLRHGLRPFVKCDRLRSGSATASIRVMPDGVWGRVHDRARRCHAGQWKRNGSSGSDGRDSARRDPDRHRAAAPGHEPIGTMSRLKIR